MLKQGIRILLIVSAYLLVCILGILGYLTCRSNLLGWFLIITAISYGLGGPYLLRTNLRKTPVVHSERHDLSFWLVIPGFIVVFYLSPLEYLYKSLFFPLYTNASTIGYQISGLVLIFAGMLLFSWARLTLSSMYSGRAQVQVDHILVQNGPYHLIRHPAYTSYVLITLGIACGFSSLIGIIAVPLLLVPGLIYRINIEESLLGAEFGDQYVLYLHTTKRMIPYIW